MAGDGHPAAGLTPACPSGGTVPRDGGRGRCRAGERTEGRRGGDAAPVACALAGLPARPGSADLPRRCPAARGSPARRQPCGSHGAPDRHPLATNRGSPERSRGARWRTPGSEGPAEGNGALQRDPSQRRASSSASGQAARWTTHGDPPSHHSGAPPTRPLPRGERDGCGLSRPPIVPPPAAGHEVGFAASRSQSVRWWGRPGRRHRSRGRADGESGRSSARGRW